MGSLTLGVLAHVDAGKTSLTERILFQAGVRQRLGSVDLGTTYTDDMRLERERGITIKSAVATFEMNGILVNLLDTPGHPDFIAEIERTVSLLDVAIIVVSAVEGVQAQTRVLVAALQRLAIPYVLFINKIDRTGADFLQVMESFAIQLKSRPLPLVTVRDGGSSVAFVEPIDPTTPKGMSEWLDILSFNDEMLLSDYVNDTVGIATKRIEESLSKQFGQGLVNPVFAGSAITGVGVEIMINAIMRFSPILARDPNAPVSASVFKIDRGWGGQKRFYVSVRAGTLRLRQKIDTPTGSSRITGIHVSACGGLKPSSQAVAGEIACITGLDGVRIGDHIGDSANRAHRSNIFTPPSIETHIIPSLATQSKALWVALNELAEQDPLIDLRRDIDGEVFVSLYGEVQKEIISSTLQLEYGMCAIFEESKVICVEMLMSASEALESIHDSSNPFLATIGIHVSPRLPGSGYKFTCEARLGQMPMSFYKAIEESVFEALQEGVQGWRIPDCEVTLTVVGYQSPTSTAADFRYLSPLVLASAIRKAGTRVCEPRSVFRIDLPPDTSSAVYCLLLKSGAAINRTVPLNEGVQIEGTVATRYVYRLQHVIPNLTGGRGCMVSEVATYAPVTGVVPVRARAHPNPYNRDDYLRQIRS